jgi:hypothetical protein
VSGAPELLRATILHARKIGRPGAPVSGEGHPLAAAMERAESLPGLLGALIAQAGAGSVREDRERGEVVTL